MTEQEAGARGRKLLHRPLRNTGRRKRREAESISTGRECRQQRRGGLPDWTDPAMP